MTDANGEISYDRVRSLIAALSCCLGVAIALYAALREISGTPIADHTLLGWIVSALVAPITGGTVAGGIAAAILGKKNGTGSNGGNLTTVVVNPNMPAA